MRWFNNKRKEKILDQQINVFLHWCVSNGMLEGTYNFWLREFSKEFEGSVYNIEKVDVDEFLTKISVLYNGQHALDQANRAMKGLMRYYTARGRNLAKSREVRYNTLKLNTVV